MRNAGPRESVNGAILTAVAGPRFSPGTLRHDPACNACHSWRFAMPSFHIHMFEGRSPDQKPAFVEAITRTTCEPLDCSPEAVDIIIPDVRRDNWATAGKLWSE